jgi:phage terminase small subunit
MQAPVLVDFSDNPFKLSIKELRFCHEYFYQRMENASEAARIAGYLTGPNVRISASRLLSRADIQNHLARMVTLNSDAKQRYEITADRIAREYAAIAFSHAVDYDVIMKHGDLSKLSYEQRAAIKSLRVHRDDAGNMTVLDVRLHDKMQALDKLGQSLKMFTDDKATKSMIDDIQGKLLRLAGPPEGEIIDNG